MEEHPIWRGYYAKEDGNIIGRRGSPLKPIEHHTGYNVLTVRNKDIQKQYRWHRFVYECFNGVIYSDKLVINHKDGDKKNNCLSNLELVTQKDNTNHAFRNNLRVGKRGILSHFAESSEEEILEIIQMIENGYRNCEISNLLGIDFRRVSDIRHKKKWKHLYDYFTGELNV